MQNLFNNMRTLTELKKLFSITSNFTIDLIIKEKKFI